MPSLYCPGATVVPGGVSGGSMVGGPPRAVIHTYEAGYSLAAIPAARRLNTVRNSTHLVFNPVTGAKAACLPANVAARALEHPAGTHQTNRYGSVCLQVEVIAYARRPWTQDLTDAGRESWDQVLAWFDSWGIRRVWPGGAPPGQNGPFTRSLSAWLSQSGYFGHSQVPTQPSGHWDPGAIDVDTFFGDGMPTAQEIAAAVWAHHVHGVGSDARSQEAWRWLASAVHAVEGAPGPIADAVWAHETHGVGSDPTVQAAWRWLGQIAHDVEGLTAYFPVELPVVAEIASALAGPLAEALTPHVSDPAAVASAVVESLAQRLSS